VHLWNKPMLHNLRYGAGDGAAPVGAVLDAAELLGVLESLPDGLQTALGEGGGLVSGGEGQRVRLGRALARKHARLVVLDEPFRGLDRDRRRTLLARARDWWEGATLLCISHDVAQTLEFSRVIVVDGGRIVEDGAPADLARDPASRFSALLQAEEEVRGRLWSSAVWRSVRVADGKISVDRACSDAEELANGHG
jgi:ATP-binding cassette subfamily B protein